ncbi:Uncharacterized protein C14orf79 [Lonchura striata]|uniref:Uncharacterized protein C14orf79 n=1 Tax=Lonchura striata TaxID=40157 RepID=A0A218UYU0_9PASE|nr:Uncharacterized protein C14orf79 [Lonchura striata domestica]
MQNFSVVESLGNTDILHCEPPKDLAAEAGGVSLHESGCNWNERTSNEEIFNLGTTQQSLPVMNSEGRSCEAFSESSFSTSEPSGSWGDFEGFRESLDKSERFSHNLEVLVKSAKTWGADPELGGGGCGVSAAHACAEPSSLCPGMQEAALAEEDHSYVEIFKLGFPEVFVPQSKECIRSLEQVLDANNEDVWIPELLKNQLCMDSGKVWRALRDFDDAPSSRHPWSKSHCQEKLLRVLGVDANQKVIEQWFSNLPADTLAWESDLLIKSMSMQLKLTSLLLIYWKTDVSENQADIFEESNVKDDEDFRFDGFSVNDCKTLIQTKVRVALEGSTSESHGVYSASSSLLFSCTGSHAHVLMEWLGAGTTFALNAAAATTLQDNSGGLS